jgi:hypothetical protein
MKQPEPSTVFAGVDATTETRLPTWYAREHQPEEVHSLAEAIRRLPRAVETEVAYRNPYTSQWVETGRFGSCSSYNFIPNGGTNLLLI